MNKIFITWLVSTLVLVSLYTIGFRFFRERTEWILSLIGFLIALSLPTLIYFLVQNERKKSEKAVDQSNLVSEYLSDLEEIEESMEASIAGLKELSSGFSKELLDEYEEDLEILIDARNKVHGIETGLKQLDPLRIL